MSPAEHASRRISPLNATHRDSLRTLRCLLFLFVFLFVASGVAMRSSNSYAGMKRSTQEQSGVMQAPICGKEDNRAMVIPKDWDSFQVPARGHSYVDPAFGCAILRLTDATASGVAERHYYATLTPISADDSHVLVGEAHGGWRVIDLVGNQVVSTTQMPAMNSGTLLWDASDGNAFYFTRGNSLMRGTITGNAVKTAPVHTFSEYKVVILPDKTDLSIDGQSFAMWGGTTDQTGHLNIFTYNMSKNSKETPYVTSCSQMVPYIQGACVHALTQTADDKPIIGFAQNGACNECGNRLWDGTKLTPVQNGSNHLDTGYDLNGTSIFVEVGRSSTLPGESNPCPSGWGLDVRSLTNLQSATCLLDKQPDWHVGYRGNAAQPWAVVSFFDSRKPGPEWFGDSPSYQEPSAQNWRLYEDEIVLARIDGRATYRLAHARSRSAVDYWATPRAANSRDGKYVVFDSNMAYPNGCPAKTDAGDSCTDIYLIKVR